MADIKKIYEDVGCVLQLKGGTYQETDFRIPLEDVAFIRKRLRNKWEPNYFFQSATLYSEYEIEEARKINACQRLQFNDDVRDNWHTGSKEGMAILENINLFFADCKPAVTVFVDHWVTTSRAKAEFIMQHLGITDHYRLSQMYPRLFSNLEKIKNVAVVGKEKKVFNLR